MAPLKSRCVACSYSVRPRVSRPSKLLAPPGRTRHAGLAALPQDAPVVTSVAKAINAVMRQDPDYVVSPGTYDQKHIDRIGRMHNCIAYGPGVLDLAHQPDEWVGVTDMIDSAKVMAHALVQLLTDEPTDQ